MKSNKTNKAAGVFLGVLLIAALAVSIVKFYAPIYHNVERRLEQNKTKETSYEDQNEKFLKDVYVETLYKDFVETLYEGSFALYLDIQQKAYQKVLTPSDVFLKESLKISEEENVNNAEQENAAQEKEASIIQEKDINYELEDFCRSFDDTIINWYDNFYSRSVKEYPEFSYYVIDHNTGKELTNSVEPLASLIKDTSQAQNLKNTYPFYLIMKSGANGTLSISDYKGLEKDHINRLLSKYLNYRVNQEAYYYNNRKYYIDKLTIPSNITIVYASKVSNFYDTEYISFHTSSYRLWNFIEDGFTYVCIAALLCIILFVILLPFKKSWGIGNGFSTHVPFEFSALAMLYTILLFENLASIAWHSVNSGFQFDKDYTVFSKQVQIILTYAANILIWMIVLSIWYIGLLSIRRVFSLGLIRYLKENTLIGKVIRWTIRKANTTFEEIDLSAKSNKKLLKLLLINFILMALICCVWFVGIILLIPYTVILFVILSKHLNVIKEKYNLLLESTNKIAQGNLAVSMNENLGIFEALGEELATIQQGFRKAVEEETKSERMKTELITNVSHDLKTPLTAIITYINLLKEENVTEEERKTYIDTLDLKSQRLKILIEDLFEVSKASSNNITLNIMEVDLVNLIKQVLLELDDKIRLVDVSFVTNLPEEKVILNLDSEKTYRIFENLIINITKYALPHTRAYIDMIVGDEIVIVTIKNISATELNFNAEEISERFVRGDRSRNTEGSGLGLAITKSFVELQGGKFTILVDGDLFKAVMEWKR